MKFPVILKWLLWPGILVICLMGDYRAINGLKHFVSDEGRELGIEFDYPEAWEWRYDPDILRIYTFDPEYPPVRINLWKKILPVQRTGLISLHIWLNGSPELMNESIDGYLEATEAIGAEILEDKIIDVDGVSARWLARRFPDEPGLSEDFEIYNNYIVFYAKGNVYLIHLSVPYDDSDSDFVKGFEDMFASIRFTP